MSYEQRVAKMKTVADVGDQLQKAINAEKKAKRAVNQAASLNKKIELQREWKEASAVVRKLRSNLFDLEDQFALRFQREQEAAENHFRGSIQSEGLFVF